MTSQQINELSKDYIEIGSWLHSLQSTNEFKRSTTCMLQISLRALLEKVEALQADLQNAGQ